MKVVIKPFSTPYGKYIYDRETNSILSVNSKEFESFERIYKQIAFKGDVELLKEFQKKGFFKETLLENIQHPYNKMVEFHLENKIEKVTLQVTQNCNLRCAYCAYSGTYNQRSHSKKVMSYDIMEKSIDFAMQHSTNSINLDIGFYGGEPLLEFENIRKLIGYISRKYPSKKLSYSLTTNGTVFTDRIIDFLAENNFNIMVSLDGPKELHNVNRVFENGEGSFDKLMNNLLYIKDNSPEFFKRISFNTVVAPGIDYKCVSDFFDASEVIGDTSLSLATLSVFNNKEAIQYDELYFINDGIQRTKMLLSALGFINKDKVSRFFTKGIPRLIHIHKEMGKISGIAPTAHPGGPCIPGARRPMIDINGNIYPCERVSEESENMRIGNIFTGFDIDKVRAVLNIGKLTENECKNCWNFIYCGMCAASADNTHEFSGKLRLNRCAAVKDETLAKFKGICLLKENGFIFEEEYYHV